MRLWSVHPKYLDSKGLVALWREGLLAKAVLNAQTKGYTNHPQLIRFKNSVDPKMYIDKYLEHVYLEALNRGYNFDISKINKIEKVLNTIPVSIKQFAYEFNFLKTKVERREPPKYQDLLTVTSIEPHPLFHPVEGEIESWEKVKI